MGRRHVSYGTEDAHYDIVGTALLWTLEQGLKEAFTDQVRAAWAALYSEVSNPMRRAANELLKQAA